MSREKIRVAFLIPSGIGTGYTGPGIFLRRLITASADSITPLIYAGLRPGHEHDVNFMPARWTNMGNASALHQLKWSVLTILWLFIDRKKYDFVHFHGTYIFKLAGSLTCILLGKPYVLVPLAADADMANTGKLSSVPLLRSIRQMIVGRASCGFALGKSIVDELVTAGMPAVKVTSINNPVSEEFFEPPTADRFQLKHILFIGVVGDRKQALLVLDVINELHSRGLPATCTFYGPFQDQEFEFHFWDQVKKLNLKGSVKHVAYSNDIASELLSSGTLFLLPSRQEGIPGALVEAMAAGVPCLVTNVGSMGEIIDHAHSGTIILPKVDLIADASEKYFLNESLWRSDSAQAREYAQANFSSSSVASEYIKELKRIRTR